MSNQPYLRFNLNAGPSGRRPSAAQLVQLIRTQVSANHLPPGCRVPPVRVLAHQFSISKNTVQRAYNELVAQGLLENKKRIGLFLAPPQKKNRSHIPQRRRWPSRRYRPPTTIPRSEIQRLKRI